MIPADYVFRHLGGAFRLLRLDRGGFAQFGTEERDFWRSFFAAVICAPGYAIAIGDRVSRFAAGTSGWRIFAVESLAYVIGWFGYAVVIHLLCRALGRAERFVPYIVAYNWVSVPLTVLLTVTALIHYSGVPESVAGMLGFGALIYMLGVQWYVAREALEIGRLAAFGVIVLDLLLSLVIAGVSEAVLAPSPALP